MDLGSIHLPAPPERGNIKRKKKTWGLKFLVYITSK